MSKGRLRPEGGPRTAPPSEKPLDEAKEVLLPRISRTNSSSSSFVPLANSAANRLRSRSLIQRKASDSALGPLPPLIQESPLVPTEDTSDSDGPDTPAEEDRQASWPLVEKAKGAFEAASDVVFSLSVTTPGLEAGPSTLPRLGRRGTASLLAQQYPPKTVSFLEPVRPTSKPASEQVATLARPIAILVSLFVGSTLTAVALIATVPTLAIPHSLEDALAQAVALRNYASTSLAAQLHIATVMASLFVFKQAFSIPGSVLLNIIFGALYGVTGATISTCFLTAVGSIACYAMARHCSPVVRWVMPRAVDALETRLPARDQLASFLLLARLFPLLPYSALNIAAGVLHVPMQPFFWTLVLGSFPYNFVTTQCGELLAQTVGSGDIVSAMWTPSVFIKLSLVTLVSAVPVLFKTRLQRLVTMLTSKPGASYMPLPASTSPPPSHSRRVASVDEGDYFNNRLSLDAIDVPRVSVEMS